MVTLAQEAFLLLLVACFGSLTFRLLRIMTYSLNVFVYLTGTCENNLSLENGIVEGGPVTADGQLTFSCNDGYQLIGSDVITCTENFTYDLAVPACEGRLLKMCNTPC